MLKVKFLVNGNSFYYGRLLVSYKPLQVYDQVTVLRQGILPDVVEASQRPHMYLNPTTSQGGTLSLPFFTPFNSLDIPTAQWEDMGEFSVSTLQSLKHANGGTDPITISVFAWAEDVHMSVLTQTDPSTLVPQSMEYEGIVSKPASIVAKVAGVLKEVPFISPFATATEIGARSIAKMAALFGYSKPVQPVLSPFQPMTRQSMADTDGTENITRLTVDTKNELSIDPAITGVDAPDELVISNIASKESYLTRFEWAMNTNPESLLFNMVVDPCLTVKNGSSDDTREIHMPACAYASFPFDFWRGSMEYRFQIVCSGFHRGRLKFVYDPEGTPSGGSSEYNTAYTHIVDISENDDFILRVGWGQNTPWRRHIGLTGDFYSSTPLTYRSSTSDFGNGTLSVYVVNELTSPDSTIDNDISVNVFLSACDNFELASPSDYYLSQIGFKPTIPTPVTLSPQSLEGPAIVNEEPPLLDHLGPWQDDNSLVNKIHFGEVIASFRTLLKRYTLTEIIAFDVDIFLGYVGVARIARNNFPLTPGYTNVDPGLSTVVEDTANGGYVYSKMTLLNYLRPAFGAWRGGLRYTTDTSFNVVSVAADNNPTIGNSTWSVSRIMSQNGDGTQSVPSEFMFFPTFDNIPSQKKDMLEINAYSSGVSGMTRWNSWVNPVHAFEVPYYSQYRFCPGRTPTDFLTRDPFQPSFEMLGTHLPGLYPYYIHQYVAAGEDFNFSFYLSPPIIYVQTIPDGIGPAPSASGSTSRARGSIPRLTLERDIER